MKRTKKSYSVSNLMKALQDVKDGKYNTTVAAKIYDIPRQTLSDKIKGRSPATYCRPGPHPLLGTEIEEKLNNWALQNKECGFITTKDSLCFSVKQMIEANYQVGMQKYFKSRSLGNGWFKAFKKRYPNLTVEKFESCFSYTEVTKNELKKWFRKVRKYLGKDAEILIDPERIFCLGELVLPLRYWSKGTPCAHDNEDVMVLFAANVDAKFAPPLVNFKYNSSAESDGGLITRNLQTTCSTTGKLTCQTFYNYFTDVFYPHLLSQNVEFPIVLYVDARIAHTSLTLHEFCQEKGIHLISFLPNAINVIHPFEVEFLNIFKKMWKTEVEFWPARNNNNLIKPENVETVISNILQFTEFSNTIRKAFRKCGLFPFDVNAVHFPEPDKNLPQASNQRPQQNDSNLHPSSTSRRECIKSDGKKFIHGDTTSCDSTLDENVESYIIEDFVDDFIDQENKTDTVLPPQGNITNKDYDNINNVVIDCNEVHPKRRVSPSKKLSVSSHNSSSKRKAEPLPNDDVKKKGSKLLVKMTENNLDLNIKVDDVAVTEEDGLEVIKKKNKDLQSLLEKVIDLLKEKTNVCLNLEKQNSALNLQISSLKDIVSITKNLLSIRNMEVENMQKDMTSLQDKINAEKERHNKMIETVSSANKLNEDIKGEYQNQMNLFQQLREKYNEKVTLLTQENQKLKVELQDLKVKYEGENSESQ